MANGQNGGSSGYIKKELTSRELQEGILCDGKEYELVFPVTVVRLDIDPDERDSKDDKYLLYSNEGEGFYRQTKTVKDDKIEGNGLLDLHFVGIIPGLSYTLEVDLGNDQKFKLYQNRKFY